jgi:hypothetical protein
MELKKILALFVILLFIGIAVAPSINFTVVKASTDNNLVEVTSQACGIKGFGNTTVKLTKQQYQNLERYLVDFRARLNQTTTREEAGPLFKEAVVELNKYGLLPKGMSVKQAQNLVTSQYQIQNVDDFQQKLSHNRLLRLNNNSNLLCLIAGMTDNTLLIGLLQVGILAVLVASFGPIIFLIDLAYRFPFLNPLVNILNVIWSVFVLLFGILTKFLPATILGLITIGTSIYFLNIHWITPAYGWVDTFGLKGRKSWYNYFYGQYTVELDTGVIGFTGIRLILPPYSDYFLDNDNFYFGSALLVNIGYDPP